MHLLKIVPPNGKTEQVSGVIQRSGLIASVWLGVHFIQQFSSVVLFLSWPCKNQMLMFFYSFKQILKATSAMKSLAEQDHPVQWPTVK